MFQKGTVKCAGDAALWMEWALFEMRENDVPRARELFQVRPLATPQLLLCHATGRAPSAPVTVM